MDINEYIKDDLLPFVIAFKEYDYYSFVITEEWDIDSLRIAPGFVSVFLVVNNDYNPAYCKQKISRSIINEQVFYDFFIPRIIEKATRNIESKDN